MKSTHDRRQSRVSPSATGFAAALCCALVAVRGASALLTPFPSRAATAHAVRSSRCCATTGSVYSTAAFATAGPFGLPLRRRALKKTRTWRTTMGSQSSSNEEEPFESSGTEEEEEVGRSSSSAAANLPLFDASNYDPEGDNVGPALATDAIVTFEDVESEYDSVPSSNDDDDEKTTTTTTTTAEEAYENAALSDEEDRILTDREDRLYVNNTQRVESCILVGVEDLSAARKARKASSPSSNSDNADFAWTLEESMKEMRELIKTSGLSLRGEITQRLQEVNPRTYIGTGKVGECQELLDQIDAELEREGERGRCCTVVFDAELYPGQQKALENAFNKKVIENDFLGRDDDEVVKIVDRTALILDIFAQHARTREGRLQVDLALHEYRKPRLTRMWTHLERQSGSGGVGLRGPGETQLEVDKRILRDRINVLKGKIDDVQKQRDLHRRGRRRGGLPVLALVGYTNAGKSTLLNILTKAGILAEDILFATLDPTTRRVKLPGYKTHPEVLLTDTVGFIQKLPTQLVAAFRATLEEVKEADVLVHVVDVSNPCWRKQEASVASVLEDIGAGDIPTVRVFNKLDLLDPEDAEMIKYEAACAEDFSVGISSLTGEGLGDFVAVAEDAMNELLVPVELELPYSCGNEVNLIHEVGSIEVVDYREDGTYVMGRVPRSLAMKLERYSVGDGAADDGGDTSDEIDWAALGKGRHAKKTQ